MMNTLDKFWDKRSAEYGTKIEGVLLKSAPLNINFFLHNWMLKQVSREVSNNDSFRVLDIGCGYGRLSGELLKKYPKINIFGIDIAQKYVDLYNQNLSPQGKAVKADMRKLPFKDNLFNTVFVVTTLMYLSDFKDQLKAVSEIHRCLKPGGHFVIIERNPVGYSIFNLGGLTALMRGRKHSEIPAVSFSESDIYRLVSKNHLELAKKQGLPLFTLFFYLILITTRLNRPLADFLLKLIDKIDSRLGWFILPSLYIAYQGRKDEE